MGVIMSCCLTTRVKPTEIQLKDPKTVGLLDSPYYCYKKDGITKDNSSDDTTTSTEKSSSQETEDGDHIVGVIEGNPLLGHEKSFFLFDPMTETITC